MRKLISAFLILLMSESCWSITRVQFKNAGGDAVNSLGITFDSNVQSGNLIVVLASFYYGDSTLPSLTVTDNQSNTYSQAARVLDSTNETATSASQFIYYAENVVSGATTITIGGLASAYLAATAVEYSGIKTSGSLDQNSVYRYNYLNHDFVQASNYTSNSVTTTEDGELLIGVANSYTVTDNYTPDAGWTKVTANTVATFTGEVVQEQIGAATGSYASSGAYGTAQNFSSGSIATFKAASAASALQTRIMPQYRGGVMR